MLLHIGQLAGQFFRSPKYQALVPLVYDLNQVHQNLAIYRF